MKSNDINTDTNTSPLDTTIEYADFSIHTYNCLKIAGYSTLGEITNLSKLKVEDLGAKGYSEIAHKLEEFGIDYEI